MSSSTPSSLFPHGRLFITSVVVTRVREGNVDILRCLDRHLGGDWGDVSEARRAMNDAAVTTGDGAIISRYLTSGSPCVVIITDKDRSLTKGMSRDEFLDDIRD